MKKTIAASLKLFLAVLTGLALYAPVAEAAGRGNNGAGSMEFSVPLNYTTSSTISGQNGSSADVNAALSMGFGMGYNFNDHFQVNGAFTWSQRNYTAKTTPDAGVTPSSYTNTMYASSLQVNAVYYFMAGDFTPFVQGGFGTTYVDTNIPNGTGGSTCYWDPYWGYVCGTYVPTKTSSNISYSGGVGARYDVNRQFSMQGSYNKFYIDAPQTSSTPSADVWRVDFIFRM